MRIGMFATALVVLLAPSLSLAADPAIVYQTQPLGRLLGEFRTMIQSVAGDDALKEFNKELKTKLGEKVFDGFDINRPIVGYIDIPADPTNTVAVICFPITGEKEWLDFCERWNKFKPKALKDGLYEVPPPNGELKAAMRMFEGYAYVATGAKDPARALDPKTIVSFAKSYDGADVSLMSGRVYFDRLPKELRANAKATLDELKKSVAMAKLPGDLADLAKGAFEQFYKFSNRYLELSEGAKDAKLAVNLDSQTGELIADLSINAVSGTPLDKMITGMKPKLNKFAGLIGPDAAAGVRIRLPLDIPEIQAAAVLGLEAIQKEAGNNAFPPLKGTVDELLKGLVRTAKTGEVDGAAVLRGPAKDGTFTAVAGIAFDDPSGLEKELKKTIDALAPEDLKAALKWDAEKANGVNIHTLDLSKTPGTERGIKAVFGQNVIFAFAFAPKAAYAAIGPGGEAVAAIKAAMTVKPVEAPILDLAYNADKILKLVGSVEPMGVPMVAKAIGKQDKLVSAFSLDVTGGKELRVRAGLNIKMMAGWMVPVFGRSSSGTFEKVEEDLPPKK